MECSLGLLKIEVAYQESIDYGRSRFGVSGAGSILFHDERGISAERVSTILSAIGDHAGEHTLSGRGRRTVAVHLRPVPSDLHTLWVCIPWAGLRVFNPTAFTVGVSQSRREGVTVFNPSEPIRFMVND